MAESPPNGRGDVTRRTSPIAPDTAWIDRLSRRLAGASPARLSRRALAQLTAGAAGGAMLGSSDVLRAAAQQSAGARRALDDIVTAEALLVTYLGVARTLEAELRMDDDLVRLVRAVQCEEDAHHNVLTAAGGVPETMSFTVASSLDNGPTAFLRVWAAIEGVQVGLYLAAARAFAVEGDPRLVEVAFEAGAVEAQHLLILRGLRGERLPADRAFAAWRYRSTSEAIDELGELGLIDGPGDATAYPGPRERFCRGVVGLVPETTDDQPPETDPGDGPADATPIARRAPNRTSGGPR